MQKGISLLSGTASDGLFWLVVDSQAWLPTGPLAFGGFWPGSNIPLVSKPTRMTFSTTSGVLKGSFSRTVNGKSVSTPYGGVIFANPSIPLTLPDGTSSVRGGGFFSTGTASGPVELTAP